MPSTTPNRSPRRGLLAACAAAQALSMAACTTDDATDHLAAQESAVLGATTYDATCPAGLRTYVDDTMYHGRIAIRSTAFAQCIDQAMRTGITVGGSSFGPYLQCTNDPYASSGISTQVDRVIAAARSANSLSMTCQDVAGANAATSIDQYDHVGAEQMTLYNWFFNAYQTFATLPPCPRGNSTGDGVTCVVDPWGAGIIVHESMHQHGYGHGANDQANAKINCGYAGSTDAQWHFQKNTAPYIVGYCIDVVLRQSELSCGPLDTCGPGAIQVLDGINATSCHCEIDPGIDPKAGGPAAFMNNAGQLDVLVRGAASDAQERYYAASAWQPWVARGGALASEPSAVVYNNRSYVFARSGYSGLDGMIQRSYDATTGAWSTWTLVDSTPLGSAPSVVVSGGRLVAFARAADGTLMHDIYPWGSGGWSGWLPIASGAGRTIASAPAAVVANGVLMVFARAASDSTLVYRYYDGWAGAWTDWRSLGGAIYSAPSAVMVGARLAVYAANNDGILQQIYSDDTGAHWSSWYSFDGPITSAPTAMMAGSRLVIFARATDGALVHRYYDNGWTGWFSLGGSF